MKKLLQTPKQHRMKKKWNVVFQPVEKKKVPEDRKLNWAFFLSLRLKMRAFAAFIESSDFVRVVVLLLLFTHSGTALSRLKGQASSRKGRPYRLLGKYNYQYTKFFFFNGLENYIWFFFHPVLFWCLQKLFPVKNVFHFIKSKIMACYMSLSLILALYILWLTSPHKYIRESRPLSLAHTKASAVSAMRDVELSLVLLGKQDLLGKHFFGHFWTWSVSVPQTAIIYSIANILYKW